MEKPKSYIHVCFVAFWKVGVGVSSHTNDVWDVCGTVVGALGGPVSVPVNGIGIGFMFVEDCVDCVVKYLKSVFMKLCPVDNCLK